jgi:signal transduction histidine kinase
LFSLILAALLGRRYRSSHPRPAKVALVQFLRLTLVWLALGWASAISASADPLTRSVLIIDQYSLNNPWGLAFRAALVSALRAGSRNPVAVYAESLDLARFNSPQYVELLRTYLGEKYRDRPIGVVIALGSTALEVQLRLRAQLWPSVPMVFGAVDAPNLARLSPPSDVTGTTLRLTLRNAVTAARALVPGLKRIALVGEPLERQPFRRHFLQEIPLFAGELEFIDLMGLPIADLKKRLATLPADSAIYYTAFYGVGTGNPRDADPMLVEVANRPIVTDTITHLGYGTAGGIVAVPEPIAEETAKRALRILDGESPARMPVTEGDFTKPVFDWRQLRRWKVSESRLPPGSEIRFREPTLWDQYRWEAITVLATLAFQAAMIAWLLFERRRRRTAELNSRHRLLEVIHLNRTAAAGALSTSFAHELNQPLGAILSNAEAAELLLAASPPDLGQVKEILADIRQADQRATEIITHLRRLLKKSDIELQNFDLNDTIADTVHILEPEATKRGVALSSSRGQAALPVRADPVHLQQVLVNLAANGMDAMLSSLPDKRRLEFRTALSQGAEVEVSVSDSGTGIPADKLKAIFEAFYTTKQQGTGLGLSIARTIIETYGGRIWAENRAGGGAVFRFTLPLAESPA